MQVGDFVKGLPGSGYGITNEKMTRGVITQTRGSKEIFVKILDHENDSYGAFWVEKKHFEVIGHIKRWNREETPPLRWTTAGRCGPGGATEAISWGMKIHRSTGFSPSR